MNQIWQDFLISQQAIISDNDEIRFSTLASRDNAVYPVTYLGVLKVSGADATQFLQGQLTCNVKELTEQNSFFAGFCNAKGRVITTFLILKQADAFLLILPTVLLDKAKAKLQMYVLRSKVQLENVSDNYGLLGFSCGAEIAAALSLPELRFARRDVYLKLSNQHYLVISEATESSQHWFDLLTQNLQSQGSQLGRYLDLTTGLAWLDINSSEQYIPQMLNLDKLGGVSLTKGCYTGQEVVARTHYLGQVKRELFLAECGVDAVLDGKTSVIDESGQTVGQVLSFCPDSSGYKMLVIMQSSAVEAKELRLNNFQQSRIIICK
jgi:folate-binding protein YgfZ